MENESLEGLLGNVTPYVGMLFSNDESAYSFYNAYAERLGFGIKRHTSRMNNGEVTKRYFTCSREGYKRKLESGQVDRISHDGRCGCMARLIIKKDESRNEAWVVSHFEDEHNHGLLGTPSKIKTLRSHRKADANSSAKSLVNELHDCNVGPAQTARILNTISGDHGMHITAKQCSGILKKERDNLVGSQCAIVVQHFIDRQRLDPQFFYAVEIDDDGVCRSLFWDDARARTTYMKFFDVVVFDVTYKTNDFLLPFAPFTGVNQHLQSTLFGCALLADEREETFVWLFTNWLQCMFGKQPRAIITDQDPAICKAIERVFPETCHRYCIWHITMHEDEHLRGLRKNFGESFVNDYNNWKKYSDTIEESEACWVTLNEKYRLITEGLPIEKHDKLLKCWRWLDSMYHKRNHWVEAYLKNTFFAGMKSSQRSESMNAFFDGFVRSKTPLVEFVRQYEQAIQCQRQKEESEDKVCMTKTPDCGIMHEIEEQDSRTYTRKIFELFSKEFKDVFFCQHKLLFTYEDTMTFRVSSRVNGVLNSSILKCSKDKGNFHCSCGKFETMGFHCKHILYIMKQKFDVLRIPEQYILRRWTIASRYSTSLLTAEFSNMRCHVDLDKRVTPYESWKLQSEINIVLHLVENNREMYSHVAEVVSNLRKYCEEMEPPPENNDPSTLNDSEHSWIEPQSSQMPLESEASVIAVTPHVKIVDPMKCTTKGRPRTATQFKSGFEKRSEEMEKRSRTCGNCGIKGHDVRTCKSIMD